jgi:hypothetical protein
MKPPKEHDGYSARPEPKKPVSNGPTLTAGMLTQAEAARFLHIEPRTLEGWRLHRIGPRFIRYSQRCVRYRPQDLQEWLDDQVIETVPTR